MRSSVFYALVVVCVLFAGLCSGAPGKHERLDKKSDVTPSEEKKAELDHKNKDTEAKPKTVPGMDVANIILETLKGLSSEAPEKSETPSTKSNLMSKKEAAEGLDAWIKDAERNLKTI